jgi:hypothetical protein
LADGCHLERIAIARALLRNPKVLLLDEVRAPHCHTYAFFSCRIFTSGDICTGFELGESCASRFGPSSERQDDDCHCASVVNHPECRPNVGRVYIIARVLEHALLTPHSLHSYFIKEGKVSESGTHDHLLAKRGDYYEFVQLQALSKR